MINQINSFINKFIKEGRVRLAPWLLQTTSFIFIFVLFAFFILDILAEQRPFVKYFLFMLFIYFFIKKDIQSFWQIRYLQHMNDEVKSINKITEALRSTMKLDSLLDMILKSLTQEFRYERAFIFLMVNKGDKDVLQGEIGVGMLQDILKEQEFILDASLGLIPRTAIERKPFIVKDAKNDYRCEQKLVELLNLKEFATIPLIVRDNILGVLVVVADGYSKSGITEEDISLLDIFANQSAIAIQNARFYETIEQFSITDGLTGLYNHRYFQEALKSEFSKAEKENLELSLIYFDIDDFKRCNDTYGHITGDKILQDIGSISRRIPDDSAIAARYGGEEFVIILPNTAKPAAIETAEKLRAEVESHIFEHKRQNPEEKLTISIGVSTFPEDTSSRKALIEKADKRLYAAKKTGKNKVVSS